MAEKKPQQLHAGHRARLKARFLAAPDSFNDHELLELLLFYAIPQKDTNALAHRLIHRFGSLSAVIDAPLPELRVAGGIGESSSILFGTVRLLFQRYLKEKSEKIRPAEQVYSDQVGDRLLPEYFALDHERVMVIGMNTAHRVIGSAVISDGDLSSATIDMKKLARFICDSGAKFIILAHNHPSGIGLPSDHDFIATDQVADFAKQMGVILEDHIIFDGSGDYLSMAESEMIFTSRHPSYAVSGQPRNVIRKLADDVSDPIVAEILANMKN